jgi:hypothetical protein
MTEAERFALSGAALAQISRAPPPPATKPRKYVYKALSKVINTLSKSTNPDDLNFASTIKKLRKISAAINWPRSRPRDFWLFAEAKSLRCIKAVQDNDTRWSGIYNMIKRAVYFRSAIDSWIVMKNELQEFTLSDREWELAEYLLRFLEPFWRQFKLQSGPLCIRHFLCMRSYSTILRMLKQSLRKSKSFFNGLKKSELPLIICR